MQAKEAQLWLIGSRGAHLKVGKLKTFICIWLFNYLLSPCRPDCSTYTWKWALFLCTVQEMTEFFYTSGKSATKKGNSKQEPLIQKQQALVGRNGRTTHPGSLDMWNFRSNITILQLDLATYEFCSGKFKGPKRSLRRSGPQAFISGSAQSSKKAHTIELEIYGHVCVKSRRAGMPSIFDRLAQ